MKTKFILDRKTFCAKAAMISLLLAVVFRAIGTVGNYNNAEFFTTRFLLPAAACIMFLICIFIFGKKAFWLSFIPFILGVVFFILRILGNDNLSAQKYATIYIAVCLSLYILLAVLYSCTVFGAIKTKWIMVVLLGAALIFHLIFEDYKIIAENNAVTPTTVLMEIGVLCMILGMFFSVLGLRRQTKATNEKSASITPPLPGGLIEPTENEPFSMLPEPESVQTLSEGEKPVIYPEGEVISSEEQNSENQDQHKSSEQTDANNCKSEKMKEEIKEEKLPNEADQ